MRKVSGKSEKGTALGCLVNVVIAVSFVVLLVMLDRHFVGNLSHPKYYQAEKLYEKACQQGGDSESCNGPGPSTGDRSIPDKLHKRGLELYEKVCERGKAPACDDLAGMYQNGRLGIERNEAKALRFSKKACESGSAEVCDTLAQKYERLSLDKKDVKRNKAEAAGFYEKAARLYEKACENGDVKACGVLGDRYRDGKGVVRDDAKAAKFYERACGSGDHRVGCNNLGEMYEQGRGVKRDVGKALEYFKKACGLDPKNGCGKYERLKIRISAPRSSSGEKNNA